MALAASGSLTAARLARADQDLAAALRLRPLWAEAWADRAWILWMQSDRSLARKALDHALEVDPTHHGIRDMASRLRALDGPPDPDRAGPHLK
jgi:cytochrome c-type biogenesis protein CcmH/NrfG